MSTFSLSPFRLNLTHYPFQIYISITALLFPSKFFRFLNSENFNNKDSNFFSLDFPQLQRFIPLAWKQQKQDTFTQLNPQQQFNHYPRQNQSLSSPSPSLPPNNHQHSQQEQQSSSGSQEPSRIEKEFLNLTDSIISSIHSFSNQGDLFKAFKAFSLLQLHLHNNNNKQNSSLSISSLLILQPISSLLLSCTTLKSVQQGKQLHAHVINLGFEQTPVLVPKFVTFYLNCGFLVDAHIIVENSTVLHSLPWNLLISAYVRDESCGEAISAYKQMVKMGIRPDNYTYPSVLKACGNEFDLIVGREVHSSIEVRGLEWSLFVQNALVSMYAKCGEVEIARSVFEKMPHRDVVSWNSIILGYTSKGMWEEAFDLFRRMEMGNTPMNIITWNSIAGGYLQSGNCKGALGLISKMRNLGAHLDSVTMVIGLGACSRVGTVILGKEIHGYALRNLCDGNETVKNALITMYSRCKDIRHAYVLFRLMEKKSLITWNSMIAGYTHFDLYEEASFIFREMVLTGVEPNYVTIASLLPSCARVACLQHGKELHCYILRHEEFKDDLLPWNSLVDMYSKSGKFLEARKLFDSLNVKDKVTYTSMITGYGTQGEGITALRLFHEMISCRIEPDHITMVAVLSACSHSGLVSQGQNLFDKMISLYKINRRMEHYVCMVDLYGRAGLLTKAVEFIKDMPFQPSADFWATLVGCCKIHANIDIGDWAAKKLLEMRPRNSGYYVLIANMYAAARCWSKVAEVRTFMRDLGVRKAPGCAWVDIGNGFQLFLVEDRSNEQAEEIYGLLEGLAELMKEAGFVSIEDLGLALDEFEE